ASDYSVIIESMNCENDKLIIAGHYPFTFNPLASKLTMSVGDKEYTLKDVGRSADYQLFGQWIVRHRTFVQAIPIEQIQKTDKRCYYLKTDRNNSAVRLNE